jgi:hypothetical protein
VTFAGTVHVQAVEFVKVSFLTPAESETVGEQAAAALPLERGRSEVETRRRPAIKYLLTFRIVKLYSGAGLARN